MNSNNKDIALNMEDENNDTEGSNLNESQAKEKIVSQNDIKGEGQDIHEKVRVINKKKSQSDNTFILTCLKNHFVFYNLSERELENIVSKMFYCEVKASQYIFQQGENASSFFVLERGSLEVLVNNKVKRDLKPGDGFGELALLYNAPRSASVRAIDNCNLWGIDRNNFRKAVEEMITKEYEENRKFMEVVRFFHDLTNEQKDAIAAVLVTQKYYKNQNIVLEGDPASSFYIIKDGTASVLKGNKEVRKLYKGDSFGEQALYYNTVRQMTVRAEDDVKCLALGRDTLTRILGDQVQVVTFRNLQKWAFEKNQYLCKLLKGQIEKVLDAMKIVNCKAGDVIVKKGTAANQKIVVIVEGSLKKSKSGVVVAQKGAAWGEEFMLEANKQRSMDDDVVMETDGVLAEISNEQFQECIGGTLDEVLKRNEKTHEKRLMKAEQSKRKEAINIRLNELIFINTLGSYTNKLQQFQGHGQFGPVYLVKSPFNSQYYALKVFAKQQVVDQNVEKHLQQERVVFEIVNFPFIIQYVKTFKDNLDVYFLVEFVKGIELFEVIRDIGLLNTYDSQFYIASMILTVEYLHLQNIIYRDIKPENFMVDTSGYLKVIDLGTAKLLKGKHGVGNRTFTIIGTPHYMAPEIICGKGYNCLVDLWSIGICLYEFMCGMVPFGEEAEDPYEIYEEIIKTELTYPNYLKDKKAKKLMDQLLNKVPEIRLGGSYAALKANAWFENFDWDKLLEKELKAPYFPPLDKIITDADIKKKESEKRQVVNEILADQEHRKYNIDQCQDPNWDKDFQ